MLISRFDNTNVEDYLEDNTLPIAANDFGEYITIGLGEENRCIFFQHYDRGKKAEHDSERDGIMLLSVLK